MVFYIFIIEQFDIKGKVEYEGENVVGHIYNMIVEIVRDYRFNKLLTDFKDDINDKDNKK